jgi:glycosyltransferase involved in cell wall biosynthesis
MLGRIRICFLIPSLVAHGAERQLCELARALDKDRFEVHIITFYRREDWAGADLTPELMGQPGIHLHTLAKQPGRLLDLSALVRLVRLVGEMEPHIVHGYMDGNLPALLVGGLFRARVVWGIRNSGVPADGGGAVRFLAARLSGLADLILYNSEAGRRSHRVLGYRPPLDRVIPNGFDLSRFRPDAEAGLRQRAGWGIPPDVPLVGIVGRLSPVKDHETFLRAAARVAGAEPAVRFVIVGDGSSTRKGALHALATDLIPPDRVVWAGHCEDMAGAFNALSALLLTSTREGFPNVLGEALACGVPCITTRAGDAELIVGDPQRTCDPGDDAALAAATLRVLKEPRDLGLRDRIEREFGTAALARRTAAMLESLVTPVEFGAP